MEVALTALIDNCSAILAKDTCDDIEKGRLTGAVTAAEGVNSARAQLESTIAQGGNTTKGFDDPLDAEQ